MGVGIGIDFARAGFDVSLLNRSADSSGKAMARSRKALELMASAGLITSQAAGDAFAHLEPTTDIETAARGAGYVVESVQEELSLKKEVFRQLDALCPPPAILATNTSSIRPTVIAAAVDHPERVVVTHYFHPEHLVPLVEIV